MKNLLTTFCYSHCTGGQLWKEVKQEVDYLLKPQVLADAERHVRIANLTRIVLIDNLQNVIEVENPPAEQIAQLQNRKGKWSYKKCEGNKQNRKNVYVNNTIEHIVM